MKAILFIIIASSAVVFGAIGYTKSAAAEKPDPSPSAVGCLSGPRRCFGNVWKCQNVDTGQWFTLATCVPPKTCHDATGCQ